MDATYMQKDKIAHLLEPWIIKSHIGAKLLQLHLRRVFNMRRMLHIFLCRT